MKHDIQSLAYKMGVSANDLRGFLVCIKHHMDQGLSFESAVIKHMEVARGVFNTVAKASNEQRRNFVSSTFFA